MEAEISKIKELTDKELINEIESLNDEQLSYVRHLSIYYLAYEGLILIENNDETNFINLIDDKNDKKIIEKHFNYLISTVKDLGKSFQDKKEDKPQERILSTRKELYDYYLVLNSYINELRYVSEVYDYYLIKEVAKKQYKNIVLSDTYLDRFLDDVMELLIKNVNNFNEFNYIMSAIIKLTPFRMTKGKFIEMVGKNLKTTLKNMPKSLVDNEVEKYKNEFNPSFVKGYGIKFSYIFRYIESTKLLNAKDMTGEEISEEMESIQEKISEIETLVKNIKILGLLTNKLYVVYLLNNLGEEKSIDEIISSTDLDNKEELEERIDYYEKTLSNTINYFERLNEEAFNRKMPMDEGLNEKLGKTRKVLGYYNDIFFERESVLYPDLDDISDDDYVDETIDNFLQYLDRNIRSMKNLERKIKMRNLLSRLRVPFNSPLEFMNYLRGCLDTKITSKEEILSFINGVQFFMENFNKNNTKKDS